MNNTRNLFRRTKPTIKFTTKFISEESCHFKAHVPQYSSSGWCIGGSGVSKNVFGFNTKTLNNFRKPTQFIQQNFNIRAFRNSRSRQPVKETKGKNFQDFTTSIPAPNNQPVNMSDRFNLYYKPFAFTAFIGASSFIGCTIWKYEDYRRTLTRDKWFLPGSWRIPNLGPGEPESTVTTLTLGYVGSIRAKVNSWWSQVGPGERVFWTICGINALVFLAWRTSTSSIMPTLVTYFTASPNSRAICWPMLFSTFSHYSFYHFAINMFVLHSFMPAAVSVLGKEQFVCFYLTAAVVSSLGSHLQKLVAVTNIPSLGASGAIMAVLGLVCTKFPEFQLGIIFIPGLTFSAETALKCMIAVDSVGILAGWKFIDHAAHLSGTLFGLAFSKYAHHLSPTRDFVLEAWHDFRNRTSS